jgi:hypothetical protein
MRIEWRKRGIEGTNERTPDRSTNGGIGEGFERHRRAGNLVLTSALPGYPQAQFTTSLAGLTAGVRLQMGDLFKRHRQEQSRALEQANRTLAAKALNATEGKLDKASFYQLVYGAAIMTDKARLLAGEPTEIHATLDLNTVVALDKLAGMLAQSLIDDPNTIDITPTQDGSGNQGGK